VIIEILQGLAAVVVAGLAAAGLYIGMGRMHRWLRPVEHATEEDRPPDYEGHTRDMLLFLRGVRPEAHDSLVRSHRGPR